MKYIKIRGPNQRYEIHVFGRISSSSLSWQLFNSISPLRAAKMLEILFS